MRLRPSYANLVSTLALVLVVSGGAYAATQLPWHSVGTKQLKPNAVNAKKVKNGSLKAVDLRPGQLAMGLAGTPMGGDLAGTFPNPTLAADAFDGLVRDADLDAAIDEALEDVVIGARVDEALVLTAGSGHQPLVSLPGLVSVTASCVVAGPTRGLEVRVTNNSPASWAVAFRQQSEDPVGNSIDSDTIGPGGNRVFVFAPDSGTASARYLSATVLNIVPIDVEVTGVTSNLGGLCIVRGSVFRHGGAEVF